MGRKIPGKKHRKIKDPFKQKAVRDDSLKDKINNPVSNVDIQEIPKSALHILKLKEMARDGKFDRKRRKGAKKKKETLLSLKKAMDKEKKGPGRTKPDKFIPNVVQKPYETPERFLRRVSAVAHDMIKEVQFEEHYKVQIERNLKTGEVTGLKKQEESGNKKKSKKMSLSKKRKEKKAQKNSQSEEIKDFSQFKDKVEFGEVVHKPPSDLPTLKGKNPTTKKPGTKSDLLLKNIISGKEISKPKNKLSSLEKQKAELQRKSAVEAYRKVKNSR